MNAELPSGWRYVTDESNDLHLKQEWQEWRNTHPLVALTVAAELRRELSRSHPLQKVECKLVAWDITSRKDYLFSTPSEKAPFVMAHLTWDAGSSPVVFIYASIENFTQRLGSMPKIGA